MKYLAHLLADGIHVWPAVVLPLQTISIASQKVDQMDRHLCVRVGTLDRPWKGIPDGMLAQEVGKNKTAATQETNGFNRV